MAGKSTLPLLLAAGVGAVLLSKKKPASKKSGSSSGIVASGKIERTSIPKGPSDSPLAYEWRVRKSSQIYLSEVGRPKTLRDPVVKEWTGIGEADTVDDAKMMAIAWIGQQPGYEPDVEVVDSGIEGVSGLGDFEWRVITDAARGHVGQYRLGEGPWFSAVEAFEYTQQLKMSLFDAAIKELKRLAEEFESL